MTKTASANVRENGECTKRSEPPRWAGICIGMRMRQLSWRGATRKPGTTDGSRCRREMKRTPSLRLGDWADRNGLAPWSVSRGFFQVFGITPEAFRLRCRTRKSCNAIARQGQSLCDIAAACGFCRPVPHDEKHQEHDRPPARTVERRCKWIQDERALA